MPFGTFKPEHLAHIMERQTAMEQLEKVGNVWIGPDLAVEKTVVIPPEQLVQGVGVVVNKKNLPPGLDITRGAMSALQVSVRSFFAQVGIDIAFHGGPLSDETLQKIDRGEDTVIPVDVINNGQRAIELEGNIMRFFWANERTRLRGQEILQAIRSGEFAVEGVEGEDWFLGGYDPNKKIATTDQDADQSLCVVVRLKPEKYYVPPAQEPLRKDNTKKIRDDLSSLLKPIPAGEELPFEISETPRIRVGENLVAVINTGAEQGQKHINSPLIDSGSDWPIRTETLNGLQYLDFFLYKKQNNTP